ncbi:TcaA second domain-containing protein [Halobacillus campisalis]|uniref:DUF4367 domain-containing protein n=1 Tax=Halobacillus campisalis TaxID=435909 RepID=A0ABW2K4V4_9BACI|nr:hypothetical protein [Halobacillus campisalis]
MEKCIECGNEVHSSNSTCEECTSNTRAKQPSYFAASDDWLNASQYYERHYKEQKKNKNKNWKKIFTTLITVAMVIGLSVTGWAYLSKITSSEYIVHEFENAVKENDAESLLKLIDFQHASESFKLTHAENMVEHFNKSSGEFVETLGYLRASADGAELENEQMLHVSNQGSKWLMFNDYKLQLTPENMEVFSTQSGVKLYLNNEQLGTLSKGTYELSGLPPGEHELKGVVEIDGETYDEVVTINTYELSKETVEVNFEDLNPQAVKASLEETLEADLQQAVSEHVEEYVTAFKEKDITVFNRMRNDSYLEDTKLSIEEMESLGQHYDGEIKGIFYEGNPEVTVDKETGSYKSTMSASFDIKSGYYLDGEGEDSARMNKNTYSWEYDFTFDDEENLWVITSGKPMTSTSIETAQLESQGF